MRGLSQLTRGSRTISTLRREWRRQISGRRRRLAGRDVTSPFVWVRDRGVPVASRIDPRLRLSEQQRHLADRVTGELTARKVVHWWLPREESRSRVLCVRTDSRAALLSVLADLATPSWYIDSLHSGGSAVGSYLSAANPPRRLHQAPGLTVWESVADSPDSTFVAGREQGLTVFFWRADTDDRLTCLVANEVAASLPVEQCRGLGTVPRVLRRPLVSTVSFPVDVVYTWVDGLDENWLAAKARVAGVSDERLFTQRANGAVRFADHDELRYSLRALEQFAPWVNHVWIVTADQHPSWLARHDPWVTVVPHRDIWPTPTGLPTFNSHAIEACLHRIPGLAEHFLYLNDDMIFGRPLGPERFFHANGIGKLFLSKALVDFTPGREGAIASSTAAQNARRLLQERFGVSFTRKFFHTAAALTVSGLDRLEGEFGDTFRQTRQAQFRTVDDVAAAGSLYLNYGYHTGLLVPGRLRYTYIDPAAADASERLAKLVARRDFDAFCVNDGTSDETPEHACLTDQLIRSFLRRYLPVPGTFENDSH